MVLVVCLNLGLVRAESYAVVLFNWRVGLAVYDSGYFNSSVSLNFFLFLLYY